MKLTGADHWLAAIAFAVLCACSNGRGSVSDPAGPVGGAPPPENPPDPPPDPPPAPPPDPDPPPPEPPSSAMAGYWKGTAEEDSNRRYDVVAMIDAKGDAQWLLSRDNFLDDDGFVLFGNVCCDARFADDVSGKELGETRARNASIDAELDGGILRGRLEFDRREYSFTLSPSAEYDQSVSLASLAGVYTRRTNSIFGEEVTLTLTIEANGRLNGSYSNGCVFNGNASIPDAGHNMVQLEIDLANCGSHGSSKQWNGAYTGLGVLLADEDVFFHSVIGPTWLGPQSVER